MHYNLKYQTLFVFVWYLHECMFNFQYWTSFCNGTLIYSYEFACVRMWVFSHAIVMYHPMEYSAMSFHDFDDFISKKIDYGLSSHVPCGIFYILNFRRIYLES